MAAIICIVCGAPVVRPKVARRTPLKLPAPLAGFHKCAYCPVLVAWRRVSFYGDGGLHLVESDGRTVHHCRGDKYVPPRTQRPSNLGAATGERGHGEKPTHGESPFVRRKATRLRFCSESCRRQFYGEEVLDDRVAAQVSVGEEQS